VESKVKEIDKRWIVLGGTKRKSSKEVEGIADQTIKVEEFKLGQEKHEKMADKEMNNEVFITRN
jgi:hypothetical protein